jgi:hypothetical protein
MLDGIGGYVGKGWALLLGKGVTGTLASYLGYGG